MRENMVKRRLADGAVTVGSWVALDGALAAEIMANAGFDWLVVDMEHGPLSLGAAQGAVTAIRTTGTVPLVRVGWNDSALIQQGLDTGAYGIVVPMVNTAAEAERAVRDARYPPLGERSRGGVRPPLAFGTDPTTYGHNANRETLLLVQIETAEAVAAAEEIAAVEGVDGLFLGPNDLASSLGTWPPVWEDQPAELAAGIARIPVAARAHGKAAGIMVPDATIAHRCIALGYTFISLTTDARFLAAAARQEREKVSGSET